MPDSRDTGSIRAAGAVVWRPGAGGPDIALVHRPRYDDWSYPKGKLRREEHVLAAACREVAEETGFRIVLGRPLTPSVYRVSGRRKEVAYWVAQCAESMDFVPNHEVDEVVWLPAAVARERLTYSRDVALLDEVRSAPVSTVPFIVLRHASAGRKAAGAGSGDLARPLDGRGVAEAKLLAGLLACYGQCRVVSSAAERCLATVRPYAAAAGVAVEVEPDFTVQPAGKAARAETAKAIRAAAKAETGKAATAKAPKSEAPDSQTPESQMPVPNGGESPGAEPEEVMQRATARAASLAASGVPTVICGHRENLPALLNAAFGALGGTVAAREQPLGKGAFWVLQSAGGVLVSAERHEVSE
jgi:8-oxo-dGTP pyrophosphatase MutT (NUDIX family)/broad specificity phosphatase PhoE